MKRPSCNAKAVQEAETRAGAREPCPGLVIAEIRARHPPDEVLEQGRVRRG